MAQRVRMKVRHADEAAGLGDEGVHALARQPPAARVEEHGRGGFRVRADELGASALEVVAQRAQRGARDGGDAFLIPLAQDMKITFLQDGVAQIEPRALAHAQPATVQDLEDGPVAKGQRAFVQRARQHGVHLRHRKHVGKTVGRLGKLDSVGRIAARVAFSHEEAVEPLEHGHMAVHRRGRIPAAEQIRLVSYDDLAIDVVQRLDPAFLEKLRVVLEVGGVRGHGQRRAASLDAQIRQVLSIQLVHPPPSSSPRHRKTSNGCFT